MTNPTPNRPLVTFALFAYNQEQYIREAIEGAFSQTYEPLEIILSDDCSSDRTFAIMQEMAAAYEGPHEVRAVKRERNLGIAFHVNTVVEEAAGKYIVFAAGDDISCSHRTRVSVDGLEEGKGVLFHSWVTPIDGFLNFNFDDLSLSNRDAVRKHALASKLYIGATGVIAKSLFDKYGPLPSAGLYEDQVFGFRASLENGVTCTKERLVNYRLGGISNGSCTLKPNIGDYICRRKKKIQHKINLLEARKVDLKTSKHADSAGMARKMDAEIAKLLSTARALDSPFREIRRGAIFIGSKEALRLLKNILLIHFTGFWRKYGSRTLGIERDNR